MQVRDPGCLGRALSVTAMSAGRAGKGDWTCHREGELLPPRRSPRACYLMKGAVSVTTAAPVCSYQEADSMAPHRMEGYKARY